MPTFYMYKPTGFTLSMQDYNGATVGTTFPTSTEGNTNVVGGSLALNNLADVGTVNGSFEQNFFDTSLEGNQDVLTLSNAGPQTMFGQTFAAGEELKALYVVHIRDPANPNKEIMLVVVGRLDAYDGTVDSHHTVVGIMSTKSLDPNTTYTLYNYDEGAVQDGYVKTKKLRIEHPPVCFSADSLIETPSGAVRAADLRPGDLVLTRDNGAQPVRWSGTRKIDAAELALYENLRPIRIRANALARNIPSSDLIVSPQHRILVRSPIAERVFGAREVLVAAKQLCQIDGIDIATDLDEIEYVHFLFDSHQIVTANGAESESLFTGPMALQSLDEATRAEILALFPELAGGNLPPAARPLASGRKGRQLAVRHKRNNKALVQ